MKVSDCICRFVRLSGTVILYPIQREGSFLQQYTSSLQAPFYSTTCPWSVWFHWSCADEGSKRQFWDSLDDSALRELATGPLIRKLNLATDHAGGLDECTREMFCLAMLVRLGKVTEEDIKLTFAAFKKLDVHDEKVLNSRAIIAGMIQKRRANLELNKANCSQTMSNRSNISMPSYGTLPFTSFGRNSSDPGLAQSNTDCDVHEETVGEQHGYQPLWTVLPRQVVNDQCSPNGNELSEKTTKS